MRSVLPPCHQYSPARRFAAARAGVAVQHGRELAFDIRAKPYFRIGFARHDEREIGEAMRRLAAARP